MAKNIYVKEIKPDYLTEKMLMIVYIDDKTKLVKYKTIKRDTYQPPVTYTDRYLITNSGKTIKWDNNKELEEVVSESECFTNNYDSIGNYYKNNYNRLKELYTTATTTPAKICAISYKDKDDIVWCFN